jgi:hypothetical protein
VAAKDETLRWPTNLDRGGIESRLVQVRDGAKAQGLDAVAALFENLTALSAAQLGHNVLAALELLQETHQDHAITRQLEMVALNLKNLKT